MRNVRIKTDVFILTAENVKIICSAVYQIHELTAWLTCILFQHAKAKYIKTNVFVKHLDFCIEKS